jgi:hypothetical protein
MATNLLQNSGNYGPLTGGAVAVTKSDVTTYDPPLRGLYLDGAGTVTITFVDGSTFTGSPATGVFHPIAGIYKVMSTGTSATGIVGFRG